MRKTRLVQSDCNYKFSVSSLHAHLKYIIPISYSSPSIFWQFSLIHSSSILLEFQTHFFANSQVYRSLSLRAQIVLLLFFDDFILSNRQSHYDTWKIGTELNKHYDQEEIVSFVSLYSFGVKQLPKYNIDYPHI